MGACSCGHGYVRLRVHGRVKHIRVDTLEEKRARDRIQALVLIIAKFKTEKESVHKEQFY